MPGGVVNVQDIYALAPLQEGILFHHLLASEGDPYLLMSQMVFPRRALLDRYLAAVQRVVDRHDILRTSFVWEGQSEAAQVVWRRAPLVVTEVEPEGEGELGIEELARRFDPRKHRVELARAPLLRFVIGKERGSERWLVVELMHHLIGDHSTLDTLHREVDAFLTGRGEELTAPEPFRNLVAQARLGVSAEEHERFFREQLGDIDEPTTPFGLREVHRDGHGVAEARRMLPASLNERLRGHARRLGVSLASLCHLAFGQVVARTSGRTRVVFGTVLFGRMQAGPGADRAMGLFINTLPLRLDVDETGVEESVRQTHARLSELLRHEHASLVLVQRCSGVVAPTPLFSALLNYRHNTPPPVRKDDAAEVRHPLAGVEFLSSEERTNYPLSLSVEDFGEALGLTAQVVKDVSPERVCAFMERALSELAEALEHAPTRPVRATGCLASGRAEAAARDVERDGGVVSAGAMHPRAVRGAGAPCAGGGGIGARGGGGNVWGAQSSSESASLPAHRAGCWARRSGGSVRGAEPVDGGGAPWHPQSRRCVRAARSELPESASCGAGRGRGSFARRVRRSGERGTGGGGSGQSQSRVFALEEALFAEGEDSVPESECDSNPKVAGLSSGHLAYVIYTSGSTGKPKGVMVEHAEVVRLFEATQGEYRFDEKDVWCLFHSIAFDFSVWEQWGALRYGGRLVIVPRDVAESALAFHRSGLRTWRDGAESDAERVQGICSSARTERSAKPSALRDLWWRSAGAIDPQRLVCEPARPGCAAGQHVRDHGRRRCT